MLSAPFKALWSALGWLWRARSTPRARALLNLLLLVLLAAFVWALVAGRGGATALPENTALWCCRCPGRSTSSTPAACATTRCSSCAART